MAIDPKKYSKRGLNPVHLKVRLSKTGHRPTHDEVLATLDTLIETGRVPRGWTFYAVNWEHPRAGTTGRSSDPDDVAAFRGIFEEMRDELRVSPVRR